LPEDHADVLYDYMNELEAKYFGALCQRHGLSRDDLSEVYFYGLDEGWAASD
jgi:hypothetical protein